MSTSEKKTSDLRAVAARTLNNGGSVYVSGVKPATLSGLCDSHPRVQHFGEDALEGVKLLEVLDGTRAGLMRDAAKKGVDANLPPLLVVFTSSLPAQEHERLERCADRARETGVTVVCAPAGMEEW